MMTKMITAITSVLTPVRGLGVVLFAMLLI